MQRTRTFVAVTLALALATACGSAFGPSGITPVADPPILPERDHDISGTITKVIAGEENALVRILVEERPGDESGSQKDVVTVTRNTRLYRGTTGELRSASAADLRTGVTVTAWYDGAVRESYPRQATAVAIVIAEEH